MKIKYFLVILISYVCALKDPTMPVGFQEVDETKIENIKLEMVFIDATKSVAVMDGKVYKVGDFIGGMRIYSITSDTVVVEDVTTNKKLSITSG